MELQKRIGVPEESSNEDSVERKETHKSKPFTNEFFISTAEGIQRKFDTCVVISINTSFYKYNR